MMQRIHPKCRFPSPNVTSTQPFNNPLPRKRPQSANQRVLVLVSLLSVAFGVCCCINQLYVPQNYPVDLPDPSLTTPKTTPHQTSGLHLLFHTRPYAIPDPRKPIGSPGFLSVSHSGMVTSLWSRNTPRGGHVLCRQPLHQHLFRSVAGWTAISRPSNGWEQKFSQENLFWKCFEHDSHSTTRPTVWWKLFSTLFTSRQRPNRGLY